MLLDTSGLLCLIDRADRRHVLAKEYYQNARLRFTHSYVLAELIPLAQTRGLPKRLALTLANGIVNEVKVDIAWVSEPLHRHALQLLENRHDKTYSLCDAVSFVLLRERGLSDALTTDKHFEQEGFTRLLLG